MCVVGCGSVACPRDARCRHSHHHEVHNVAQALHAHHDAQVLLLLRHQRPHVDGEHELGKPASDWGGNLGVGGPSSGRPRPPSMQCRHAQRLPHEEERPQQAAKVQGQVAGCAGHVLHAGQVRAIARAHALLEVGIGSLRVARGGARCTSSHTLRPASASTSRWAPDSPCSQAGSSAARRAAPAP